ncbi:MAG: precorrin-6y C5,15-methyltransferase (decarboxylating) subunit CbiE [Nitrospirae bacterium]|nr:precorrin-6y C5,15-methyltransferase (decarboxylating) subunit CbiE [Nitrospirota bacterium]
MAKEIYLIGVGPEGRDSLVGKTLDIIRHSHLIVGGKRVINQFEDLGVPTFAMTANLRQLVEVIGLAEDAVGDGREIVLPADRRGESGFDDDDDEGCADDDGGSGGGSDDGDDGDDDDGGDDTDDDVAAGEDAPAAEGSGEPRRRDGRRRRGRRRPSPRNRGRGQGEGGDAPAASAISDNPDAGFSVEVNPRPADDADDDGDGDDPGDAAVAVQTGPGYGVAENAYVPADGLPHAGGMDDDSVPVTRAPHAGDTAKVSRRTNVPVARIALLVAGDPNFYGLSKFLLERFNKDEIHIIPHISAMQLAFAAIKEPMNDAAITSSAGRNVDRLIRVVRQNTKIGIFTDKRRSPRAVAKLLTKHGIEAQCYVCQDLGTARERIIMGSLEEIEKKNFSPLSIMILFKPVTEEPAAAAADDRGRAQRDRERDRDRDRDRDRGERKGDGAKGDAVKERPRDRNLRDLPPASQVPKYELVTSLGIPDEMLSARPEKIMRAEMRVLALSKLQLKKDHRMWDVGAGCGALSVEAARVAHAGEVLAVERDFSQIRNIYENLKGFGLSNVTVMEGDIEQMYDSLPEPDRIFIGGCGGHMKAILEGCLKRLKPGGILVLNATTLDALAEVQQTLKAQRLKHDMVIVNISRTVERGGLEYFEGFNPSYLITTVKD